MCRDVSPEWGWGGEVKKKSESISFPRSPPNLIAWIIGLAERGAEN